MAWIESHTTLRTHKKLKPLCDDLRINRAQAIGHLHMLWWWTIENRETGDLSSLYPQDIANAAEWRGEAPRLIKALKKHGWLTKDMKINDWMDYAGRLLKDRIRGRIRRKSTDASEDCTGAHPRLPNQTEPNRTVPLNTKTGLLSDEEQKIVLQDIATKRNVAPESESAQHRLKEICVEIGKIKGVKNALGMARHKALNQ